MPAFVTDILRLPLFPVAILGALGFLYWHGMKSSRAAKEKAAQAQPGSKADRP